MSDYNPRHLTTAAKIRDDCLPRAKEAMQKAQERHDLDARGAQFFRTSAAAWQFKADALAAVLEAARAHWSAQP